MSVTYQIVYWRDIPAQIKLRSENGRLARSLSPRFQEAIDAAAMRANATGTDAYLEEWRTSPPQHGEVTLKASPTSWRRSSKRLIRRRGWISWR